MRLRRLVVSLGISMAPSVWGLGASSRPIISQLIMARVVANGRSGWFDM